MERNLENEEYFSDDDNDGYGDMSTEQKEAGLKLVRAVKENDQRSIEMYKTGPFIPDELGITPLHYSAQNGSVSVVDYLLSAFPEVHIDHTSAAGRTALQIACCMGHVEVVRLLVESGADVNKQDTMGYHSLLWTAEKGHAEVAEYLLTRTAANWRLTNNWEEDVFELAALTNNSRLVSVLNNLCRDS